MELEEEESEPLADSREWREAPSVVRVMREAAGRAMTCSFINGYTLIWVNIQLFHMTISGAILSGKDCKFLFKAFYCHTKNVSSRWVLIPPQKAITVLTRESIYYWIYNFSLRWNLLTFDMNYERSIDFKLNWNICLLS